MNSKITLWICIILVIVLIAISLIVEKNKESVVTSITVSLSSDKIEWGIKRSDNHTQPDLGKKNRELIEKYKGIAIGNNQDKYIYLTFDNGYEAGYTTKILDTLKENNVLATFFVTAHYVNTASDLVQRMIDEGHIIGNHTVNHKSMPGLSEEEINNEMLKLHTAVKEKYRL